MTDYFVKTGGNDAADGLSDANAWETIGKVNGFAFAAEDNVQFKGGNTWSGTTLTMASSASGTSDAARVTITSYGTGQAVINGTGQDHAIRITGKDFFTFDNLQIEATAGGDQQHVMEIDLCDDLEILNCEFPGNFDAVPASPNGRASHLEFTNSGACLRFLVDNCNFIDSNNGDISVKGGTGTDLNATISNCTFKRGQRSGEGDFLSWNNQCGNKITVSGCDFDNQDWGGGENAFDIKNGTGHVFENCTFTSTRQSFFIIHNGSGVTVNSEVTLNDCTFTGLIENGGHCGEVSDSASATFNRCKFVANGTTGELFRIDWPTDRANGGTVTFNACSFEIPTGENAAQWFDIRNQATVVYDNCTLLARNGNTTTELILVHNTYTGAGVTIRNTILDTDGTTNLILHSDVADPFTLSHNLYESGATDWFDINGTTYQEADVPATYGGANSVTGDPIFSNEDETDANYLTLGSTSPGASAGSNAFNPATDLVGNAYQDPPNIGARATESSSFPQTEAAVETQFGVAATDHNVTLPATVNPGDLLLIFFATGGNLGSPGTTVTTPTDYTEKYNSLQNENRGVVYAKPADGTEGGTTVNIVTADAAVGAAQSYRVTNWYGDLDGVEVSADSTGSGTTPNPLILTPSWGGADTLWFAACMFGDDDVAVTIYPTNFGNGVDTISGGGSNSGNTVGSAWRAVNATSQDPDTFTIASSETWNAVTVAVRPPAQEPAATAGALVGQPELQMSLRQTALGGVLAAFSLKSMFARTADALGGAVPADNVQVIGSPTTTSINAPVVAGGIPFLTTSGFKIVADAVTGAITAVARQTTKGFAGLAGGLVDTTVSAAKQIIAAAGLAGGLVTATIFPKLSPNAVAGAVLDVGKNMTRAFTATAGGLANAVRALAGGQSITAAAVAGGLSKRILKRPITAAQVVGGVLTSVVDLLPKIIFSGGLGTIGNVGRSWTSWRTKSRR